MTVEDIIKKLEDDSENDEIALSYPVTTYIDAMLIWIKSNEED